MTVGELIEALTVFPAHYPVLIKHPDEVEFSNPQASFLQVGTDIASIVDVEISKCAVILDATGGLR